MGRVGMSEWDPVGWAGLSPVAQAGVSAVSLQGRQVPAGYGSPAHAGRGRQSVCLCCVLEPVMSSLIHLADASCFSCCCDKLFLCWSSAQVSVCQWCVCLCVCFRSERWLRKRAIIHFRKPQGVWWTSWETSSQFVLILFLSFHFKSRMWKVVYNCSLWTSLFYVLASDG